MAGQLDDGVLNSVINEEFKVVASAPTVGLSQALSLAALDAVSHQRIINGYRELAFAEATGQRAGMDISEAVASKKVAEADLSRSMSELVAVVTNAMQQLKGGQSTPPETAKPTA